MNELSTARLWMMRGIFAFLVLFVLFFQLLPLQTMPRYWSGPDLLLCAACAWSLRRPEYVPAVLLAGAFLLADFLLQRPPGLWALLALAGCENLKSRGRSLRDANFLAEWFTVGVIVTIILIANRIILSVTLIGTPHLSLTLTELGATILAYPVIVALTHFLLRVRKLAPGDLDPMSHRI